jgi:hypothetical protein
MRSIFYFIAGSAAIGFLGFFAATLFGVGIMLFIAFLGGRTYARIYFGTLALSITIAVVVGAVFFFDRAARSLLSATSTGWPDLALCVGFLVGLANDLRAFKYLSPKSTTYYRRRRSDREKK